MIRLPNGMEVETRPARVTVQEVLRLDRPVLGEFGDGVVFVATDGKQYRVTEQQIGISRYDLKPGTVLELVLVEVVYQATIISTELPGEG